MQAIEKTIEESLFTGGTGAADGMGCQARKFNQG